MSADPKTRAAAAAQRNNKKQKAAKKRHVVVAIECDLPPNVSAARFKQYLLDEAKANVGQLPTEDPLFDLDRESVRATIIPRDIEWFLRKTQGGMDSELYRRWFA